MIKFLQLPQTKSRSSAPKILLLSVFLFSATIAFSQSNEINYSVPSIQLQDMSTATQVQQTTPEPIEEIVGTVGIERDGAESTPGSNLFVAPPGNDNCAAGLNPPYVLTPNSSCVAGSLNGTNPGPAATVEVGETFGCNAGPPTRSVWYSFIATQANMWVSLKQTGTPGPNTVCTVNPGIRVSRYTGTCPPAGGVACQTYTAYGIGTIHNTLNLTTLVAGTTYLIQIVCNPACLDYNFCIKIGTPTTCTTCGSSCGPICIMAGASPPLPPQVVSTCPGYPLSPPMNAGSTQSNCYTFTAPNDTIFMQQVVYAYCAPGNTISFTYSLYTAGCGLIQSGNVFASNIITGLTIGTNYQICYTLTSACSWDSLIYPYVYTTSNALPVELIAFDASPSKDKVQISWSTASELNSKEFIIERTRNALDFEEIAHVKGAGTTTTLNNYRSFDLQPLNGNNYYRLKQIDFNGSYSYSKLAVAVFESTGINLSIIPNPANDDFALRFQATGNSSASIKISDIRGKELLSTSLNPVEGITLYAVSAAEFSQGIYFVQLTVDDQISIAKLVKD
ncbi:MAG: T9SS type A sorting domain-containing protein [Bacteroidia bacterium]